MVEPYEVLHQDGLLSVEMDLPKGNYIGDVGIQIARDGRIWLCFNGGAFIRFKPMTETLRKLYGKIETK